MAVRRKVIYEAEFDGDDVVEGLEEVDKVNKKTTDNFKEAWGQIDSALGGIPSKMAAGAKGVGTFVKGLKSVRMAVIGTGIGALLIAVTGLVTYFTKTRRGAELLEVATASLGAVVSTITDSLSALGELLVDVFTNPRKHLENFGNLMKTFITDRVTAIIEGLGLLGDAIGYLFEGEFSKAADTAKEGIKKVAYEGTILNKVVDNAGEVFESATEAISNFGTEVADNARKAAQLQRQAIALRQAQRELRIEVAESRAAIKDYNLTAEDTTKTFEERADAARKAIAIEQDLMDERIRVASEELRIHQQQMALSESTEEDYEKESELIAAVSQLRMESLELQTTLNNKLNTIEQARQAAIQATIDLEQKQLQERYDGIQKLDAALATEKEKQIDAVVQRYDELFLLAEQYGYDEQELAAKQKEELSAIEDKYRKEQEEKDKKQTEEDIKRQQALFNARVQMAGNAIVALQALSDAFGKGEEQDARRRFKRNKAFNIAQAVIQTGQAVTGALTAGGNPLKLATGAQFVEAGIAAAIGAAQIATIAKQEFQETPSTTSTPRVTSGATAGGQQSPNLDVGFLGQGTGVPMMRTYVISKEVTNTQQAEQLVNEQASLLQ